MVGAKIMSDFMSWNGHAKRRHCFEIRNAIRACRTCTNNPRKGNARGSAQTPAGPQMRHVAWRAGKVSIPYRLEFVEHRDCIAARRVGIVRRVPGVLEYDREGEPDVSLINRLNLIHDTENVVVRGGRRSAEALHVFKVRFGSNFGNFER